MRPRFCSRSGIVSVALLGFTLSISGPAAAQSLFETLFGPSKPAPNRLLPPSGINAGSPYKVVPRPADREERFSPRAEERGSYHTVCVRMCDGYYWPISYSASRSRLYRDANACSSSCGAEAKLFHYRDHGSIEDAVDLSGLAYTRLPTAFKYRKAIVEGCACRPAPWSETEIDRHRVYGLNAEIASGHGSAAATKAASVPVPPPSGPEESLTSTAASDFTPPSPHVAAVPASGDTPKAPASLPDPKPVRSASHDSERSRPAVRRLDTRRTDAPGVRKAASNAGSGGFFGFGGQSSSKLVWPGDAPPRVR